MKIAYITNDHISMGGREKVVSFQANYLVEQGYEVYILSNSQQTNTQPFFYHDPRIKFIPIRASFKKKLSVYLDELTEILNEIKVDIVISTAERNSRYVSRIKDGSKKILQIHNAKYRKRTWLSKFDTPPLNRLVVDPMIKINSSMAKSFDAFVVLTQKDFKQWTNLSNIHCIPNPLFDEVKQTSSCDSKRVISLGRFVTQKRYDLLIDSWSLVAKKHPDWHLDIFGEGSKQKYLEKKIKEKGVSQSLTLNKTSSNISDLLVNSSIYVQSSKHEGFGLALLEGVGHGLPCVAFDVFAGPSDIITDGEDGFLVPYKNIEMFAQMIIFLIENEEIRKQMGRKAVEKAKEFSFEKIMKQWEALFKELVQ